MERWLVALFIVIAVAIGMGAQAWVSWLEHKRRTQAMEVIKAAIEAGREPPAQLYEQLREDETIAHNLLLPKRPWTEAVFFAAIGVGFWVAYANAAPDKQATYLVIAATMSATALGCLALAAFHSRNDKR